MEETRTRFKDFLNNCDLKNKDIAIVLSFGIQKISDLKNGKQRITPEIALLLEDKFNVNPVWLIFGRGAMYNIKMDLGVDDTNKTICNNNSSLNDEEFLIARNEIVKKLEMENEILKDLLTRK